MKAGSLVRLIGSFDSEKVGLIVSCSEFSPGWHTISCGDELIHWPESQLELLNENR